MRPTVSRPAQRSAPTPMARTGTASASLTTPTDEMRGLFDWEQPPGDEPGTLADVMDGTLQQDPEKENNETVL
jgi:hypothetical protein